MHSANGGAHQLHTCVSVLVSARARVIVCLSGRDLRRNSPLELDGSFVNFAICVPGPDIGASLMRGKYPIVCTCACQRRKRNLWGKCSKGFRQISRRSFWGVLNARFIMSEGRLSLEKSNLGASCESQGTEMGSFGQEETSSQHRRVCLSVCHDVGAPAAGPIVTELGHQTLLCKRRGMGDLDVHFEAVSRFKVAPTAVVRA